MVTLVVLRRGLQPSMWDIYSTSQQILVLTGAMAHSWKLLV